MLRCLSKKICKYLGTKWRVSIYGRHLLTGRPHRGLCDPRELARVVGVANTDYQLRFATLGYPRRCTLGEPKNWGLWTQDLPRRGISYRPSMLPNSALWNHRRLASAPQQIDC